MKIVIDVPEKVYDRFCRGCRFFDEVEEAIIAITDGTPLPKGHWVFDEVLDRHYYCSECKSMGVDYWDYCPNCGAKMTTEKGKE